MISAFLTISGTFGKQNIDNKKMKRVVILGSTGMLGNAVGKYFLSKQNKYQVFLSYRNETVSYGENKFKFDPLVDSLDKIPACDYIINCIGIIKPHIEKNRHDAIILNSLFPWRLAAHAEKNNVRLIQITTDCVFSGSKGGYDENSEHDALDFYGKSKSLGEPDNAIVLRTSIIGEELHNHASLISWAQSMKDKDVNGFTNHLWNGITTNQYAKICENIIDNNLGTNGIYHVFSNPVTKYELLDLISKKFNLGLKIKGHQADVRVDRTLSTVKDLNIKLAIPSVAEMLNEN